MWRSLANELGLPLFTVTFTIASQYSTMLSATYNDTTLWKASHI